MSCIHAWKRDDAGEWVCVHGCGTTYPPAVARSTDPETSWEAAESVKGIHMTRVRQGIHDLLVEFGPMTDEEIWRGLVYRGLEHLTSPSGARTRRSELVTANRVHDTGHRKKGKTGRKMIVWAVTK